MIRQFSVVTISLVMAASGAAAQGFSGATLGIDYTKSLDSSDLGGVNYYGQAEVEAIAGIGFALDVSAYDFALAGSDAQNVTGHAIYAVDPQITLGAYFGRDWVDDDSIDTIGLQGAFDFGIGRAQGYVGLGDGVVADIVAVGASGSYDFGGGISAIAAFDRVGFDGGDGLSYEIGGEYVLAGGPVLSGVLGQFSVDNGGTTTDETYIGIKARIDLGQRGGTTFDRRSFFEAFGVAGE